MEGWWCGEKHRPQAKIISFGAVPSMKIKIIIGMKIINSLIACLLVIVAFGQNSKMIDPRDGKEYKTVQIGRQVWMAENLAYRMNIINNEPPDYLTFAVCYTDSIIEPEKYGFLYNWTAAQSACPTSWHLPSITEFDTLLVALGGNKSKAAYSALIENGISGFNGLIRGYVRASEYITKFTGLKKSVGFWAAPVKKYKIGDRYYYAQRMNLNALIQKAYINDGYSRSGYSVRCVKDH